MQCELIVSVASHQQGELVNGRSNAEYHEGGCYHHAFVLVSVVAPELVALLVQLRLAQNYHPPKLITHLYAITIPTLMI